jgi:hypothetical protein
MHIINTSAVEVSIHAVSPPLILSALMVNGSVGAAAGAGSAALAAAASGAAVAALAGASSAQATGTAQASTQSKTKRDTMFIGESSFSCFQVCIQLRGLHSIGGLNRTRIPFTRSDAHDMRQLENENLTVPHFTGLCGFDDGLDHLFDQPVIDRNLDLGFGYELDRILGAPVDFGVTPLPPEATHFRHGDPVHAHVADGFPHVVELERFDDCRDELHSLCPSPGYPESWCWRRLKHRMCHRARS